MEEKPVQRYPRWVKFSDGESRVVNDHIAHGRAIGKKVLPDATVVEAPTLEEVIKAGYSPERAAQIVAEEQEKEAKGHKPYGDIEPPSAAVATSEPPAPEPEKSNLDESTGDPVEEAPPAPKTKGKKAAPQPDNWE